MKHDATKKSATPKRELPWTVISMTLAGFIVGFGFRTWFTPPMLGPKLNDAPAAARQEAPPPTARPTTAKEVVAVDPKTDHIRGPKTASITVIEYSDFECPFCKRFHPTMEQLLAKDNDVQWVYRHFPLPMHAHAQKAAEATECVASLVGEDAFWKMADALIALPALNDDAMVKSAIAAGAQEKAFRDCLTSGKMAAIVQADADGGRKAGITGTPGSIVLHNASGINELVRGAKQLPALEATIQKLRLGKAAPQAAASAPSAAMDIVKVAINNGVFTPSSVTFKQNALAILEFSTKGVPASIKVEALKLATDVDVTAPKRIRVQTGKVGTFLDASGAFEVRIAQ